MAGAQGVGPKPVHEVQVGDVGRLVQAAAVEGAVLVLAKALQIERPAVQQQAGALHPDLPDAEGLLVAVLAEGDPGGVEVRGAGPGLPQLGMGHVHAACGPLGLCHRAAGRVQDLHRHRAVAHRLHPVLHPAAYVGHQGDVRDVGRGGGVEGDRPLDARIVEEIEVGAVLGPGGCLGVLHRGDARVVRAEKGDLPRLVAHRQGAVADPVVGGHRQQGSGPGGQPAGDLHLKGQETAPVLGDQRSPSSQTLAWWVTAPKRSTTRWPAQARGRVILR